jgi:hypothetical protein
VNEPALKWVSPTFGFELAPYGWEKVIEESAPSMRLDGDNVTLPKAELERLLTNMWLDGKED